jgi:uncharacterized protein (TIGR02444 family)
MKVGAEIKPEADNRDDATTAGLLSRHSLQLDSPLWKFAVSLWQDSAISTHCLALQAAGWSVTRILCASWLASLGLNFREEHADVSSWRIRVTAPLRATRQSLPKNEAAVASLRQQLARAELEAERIEIALAYASLAEGLHPQAVADMAMMAELMPQNLQAAGPETGFAGTLTTDQTGDRVNTLSLCIMRQLAKPHRTAP